MILTKKKTIRLNIFLIDQVEQLSQELGLTFQDYIKYLIIEDLRRVNHPKPQSAKKADRIEFAAQQKLTDLRLKEVRKWENQLYKKLDIE